MKKGNPGKLYPDTGVFKVDNSKSVRDLGMTYKYDFDTMLRDTLKKFEELEAEGKRAKIRYLFSVLKYPASMNNFCGYSGIVLGWKVLPVHVPSGKEIRHRGELGVFFVLIKPSLQAEASTRDQIVQA